jgi:hypothetical protein
MQAVLCSVSYGDILKLTLPTIARHFDRVLVGTSTSDAETQAICREFANVACCVTDNFYANGAEFNKGIVMDSLLHNAASEHGDGWIAILDADIILPEVLSLPPLSIGMLYGCTRRILANPVAYSRSLDWSLLPLAGDRELAGFFQLFSSADPVLYGCGEWYQHHWRHAGCADSFFAKLWPAERQKILPFEVLHLGPIGQNWFGRVTPRLDGVEVAGADQSRQRMARMLARRRATRGRNKFAGEKIAGEKIIPAE